MENEKRFTITPHIDVELGVKRNELEYFLTFPGSGIDSDTGVLFFISGFGSKADSEYERVKLRPYLADKYNCIAVGINYFGIGNRKQTGATYGIDENFLLQLNNVYSIPPNEYCNSKGPDNFLLMDALKKKGIEKVDLRCMVNLNIANNEYQSFGFLPAIDCLQVLGEILKTYSINKKKIIAFGTSYGGFIALLLAKFAPNTFSVIVDNSGFVDTNYKYIVGREVLGSEMTITYDDAVALSFATLNPWTIKDKASPGFFSNSHKCIRNLLNEQHIELVPKVCDIISTTYNLNVQIAVQILGSISSIGSTILPTYGDKRFYSL